MTEFDNPQAVLKFEHKWADVVNKAATSVDAQSAFNICVYKIADLKTLANPTKAFNELVEVHDELWTYTNSMLVLSDSSLTQSHITNIRELLKK
jgi:hypothetical protein